MVTGQLADTPTRGLDMSRMPPATLRMRATKLVNSVKHLSYENRLKKLKLRVPGLFMPKTFRSQERIVPMGNFRSGDFSFLGTKVPWNFRSRAFSFSGTFVPGERKFLGTVVPWTFRSEELSFPGLFVPRNFRSSDYFTRHWLWTQTAIPTVRIFRSIT